MPKFDYNANVPSVSVRSRLVATLIGFGVSLALLGCARMTATEIKPPQSMVDLLVNVREATLSGLILREDFYAEDNLKRVFGGSTVRLSRIAMDESVQMGADMGGFPPWPGIRPGANANLRLLVQGISF